jgi:integrative and conjugative element protein (TIGR02256 family)
MNIAWFSKRLIKTLISEANRKFPLETGGILIGYIVKNESWIMNVIGPGPKAIHETHSFIPDYDYHDTQIAKQYTKSHFQWKYLGDWHSHPRQKEPNLSSKDRETLTRIAQFKEARIQSPHMLILHGEKYEWEFAVWQFRKRRLFRSKITPITFKQY